MADALTLGKADLSRVVAAGSERHSAGATAKRTPVLHVEGLNVSFGLVEAVRNVSLDVFPGEVLALVGESGSGKSVTARTLVGLPGKGAYVEAGAISLHDHTGSLLDLRSQNSGGWRRIRGRHIGLVLQDALSSLDPLRKIGLEVAEPITTHGLFPRTQIADRVNTLLTSVGIPDPQHRAAQYPHELSGGLRQRALIASALAGEPKLLIADEPTTALDVTLQRQVLAVFADLARAGHAILLITHDLAVVAQIADRIAVMRSGEIVETGYTRNILLNPCHPYTRSLLAAIPSGATRGQRLSLKHDAPIPKPHDTNPDASGKKLLEVRGVSLAYKYPDGSLLKAVDDVSLDLRDGETLGIVGESGSGKTTLGKLILGLRRPDDGDILFQAQLWSALPDSERRSRRAHIQTITQDPLGSFDPRFTVERIISQPLRVWSKSDGAARRHRITELLNLVGLDPALARRRPAELSGGQRQRVSIAQALASNPALLVCDEPVSALDVTTQAQILDLLTDLQQRLGLAMIFISHDLGVVQHISHRIAVMKDGVIVESGSVQHVFDAPRSEYTRKLLNALPRLPSPSNRK
ncbi:ABC transporter ATP-binding protein [Phyllobacterium sp. SB3]|uniref:ABC transporter ATP-binding protein n=1 Tax=Phyllobacterium sp. SB3 TaxID=3156073 RepID=UPI0032AEE6CC